MQAGMGENCREQMDNYLKQWKAFMRARNITLAILIGGCALDLFLPPIYASLTHTQDDAKLSTVVFIVWAIASVAAGQRLMNWKCPRCGNVFCGGAKAFDRPNAWFNWLFLPRNCLHCGLPKFALSPEATEPGGES
jgi:hypothetical protein